MSMFGFLSHGLHTHHKGQSNSGLSPRIWSRLTKSITGGSADGSRRLFLAGDDFAAIHHAGTVTDLHSEMPYVVIASDTTNHDLLGAADENGGVVQMTIDAAAGANEEIGIEAGDGTGQLGQISDTAGADFLTAFECRIKVDNVTDTPVLTTGDLAMFAGLASPGTATAEVLVDTTGVPKAASAFIGFNVLADDGDSMDFSYQTASGTLTAVIEGVHVPVADTYVKLGFVYDPSAPASRRITVYVDNVEQSATDEYVTATNIAAAAFPDAEALTFVTAMKGITGSIEMETSIDWWAFAQVIV